MGISQYLFGQWSFGIFLIRAILYLHSQLSELTYMVQTNLNTFPKSHQPCHIPIQHSVHQDALHIYLCQPSHMLESLEEDCFFTELLGFRYKHQGCVCMCLLELPNGTVWDSYRR